jgi:hypothetical protein
MADSQLFAPPMLIMVSPLETVRVAMASIVPDQAAPLIVAVIGPLPEPPGPVDFELLQAIAPTMQVASKSLA